MARSVSWPHEHGALLTLVAAGALAVLLSPYPAAALGVALVLAAAFFAREPLVRRAPRDGLLLGGCAVAAAGGVVLVAGRSPGLSAVAATGALAMLAGFFWAKRARQHRAPLFESLGMGALGASAGLGALAGGLSLAAAVGVGFVLAVHALVTVPLVRSEVRRRERVLGDRALGQAMLGLVAAALVLWVGGAPRLGLAFAPRVVQIVWQTWRRPAPLRPAQVGARETVLLAATLGLVLLLSPSA